LGRAFTAPRHVLEVPEPLSRERRYLPGLDGLRALAVAAVVAYHLGFGWAAGGFLGVSVFFTLSGYLITDLILAQRAAGSFRVVSFWVGRARRLLPALAVLLLAVTVWAGVAGRSGHGYTGELVAAALYVGNWQLVFRHVSYFARFAPPSPIEHLWSLGVEEQFYLVWPALLLLGARVVPERRRSRGTRPRLALLTLALAAASAVEMALLYRPGFDSSRVYFGTDTRAFELLVGAAVAMVWPSARLGRRVSAGARRLLDATGLAALAVVALVVWTSNEYSPFLYRGGFAATAVATAVLVAVLAHPRSRVGELVGTGPFRWVGVRSYGIYLWHLPVIVLTTPASDHHPHPVRTLLQVAAILALAALSWRWVEEPIRRGALAAFRRRRRPARRRRPYRAPIVLVPALVLALICTLELALSDGTSPHPVTTTTVVAARVTAPKPPRRARASKSACRAVVHIGDSTSEGLTSTDYLPNPIQRMDSRYRQVGVSVEHFEIAGARSIVETYEGEPNAADVIRKWKADGYRGCWVLALGTNDTANVAVGSPVGRSERIREVMSLIGRQPVLWVDVKSLLSSGPYSEANMRAWNAALLESCRRYPNMRVYDWSSAVKDKWFIADGIHYNTPGYAARARLIAAALATAFPAEGGHRGCVVRT
jgi:peptidoglycan/LPS O-acetylase OafA/YrhL